MVKHQHGLTSFGKLAAPNGSFNTVWGSVEARIFTDFAGETDGTGKNIPVYKAVYIWERIA